MSKYSPSVVTAFFRTYGIASPAYEYRFHPTRQWRFDICWPSVKVALEVDGGIWVQGRHNRGAAMLGQWDKENQAHLLGWRLFKCQPKDLMKQQTALIIRMALGLDPVKP